MKRLLILTGHTCSGKSELSRKLATNSKFELIAGDVMQMYKNFPVAANVGKKDLKCLEMRHDIFETQITPEL